MNKYFICCFFKVYPEWTDLHWPNLTRLKNIGLIWVFASFGILVFIPVFTFCLVSLPYGWPHVSFFIAVPQSKKALVFVAIVTALLLPLLVSCVLYVLIYFAVITKDLNKVGVGAVEEVPNLSDDIFVDSSQFGENEVKLNDLKNETQKLKMNAERLSALRSLKTNLYFIIISMLPLLILLLSFTKSNRVFFCVQYYSVNKCFMTLSTTIVNFGPIREILSKFWKALKERKSALSNSPA
jgi:hypothetical protein